MEIELIFSREQSNLSTNSKYQKTDESQVILVKRPTDAVWCSRTCSEFAATIGFGKRDLWSISISVSELVTNAIKFAGSGRVSYKSVSEPSPGIEICVEDDGPGCEDIGAASEDGFSEGRFLDECLRITERHGLGNGLGAVKRFMDKTVFENRPEGGFRATITKFLNPPLD